MNQKYKFLIAGSSNTAITFGLYALLVSSGFDYNLALIVTYMLGIVLGFVINRFWTFSGSENITNESPAEANAKSTSTQFVKYLLVYALIFMVNFSTLNLFVQAFKLDPILSQLFAVGFSVMCSYFLQRSWVFKQ